MKFKDKPSVLVAILSIFTISFSILSFIYPENRIFLPICFIFLSALNLLNGKRLFKTNRFQSITSLIASAFIFFVAMLHFSTI